VGAWEKMEGVRVAPFYKMQVWDASGPGSIHFDNSTDSKTEPLGFMIENSVIQSALYDRMVSLGNIDIYSPSTLDSIHFGKEEDWVKVSLKDGKKISGEISDWS
jgi:2-octaprenylphenol hydroxylase